MEMMMKRELIELGLDEEEAKQMAVIFRRQLMKGKWYEGEPTEQEKTDTKMFRRKLIEQEGMEEEEATQFARAMAWVFSPEGMEDIRRILEELPEEQKPTEFWVNARNLIMGSSN